jgi:DNA polymerase elongation subunit (family B)/predicted RNA-binding Zn-ribbon protein involved in translation (DUF1610 family)
MPRLTIEEQKKILELSENGYSSRKIAEAVFGDKTKRKSTINEFLDRMKTEPIKKSVPRILLLDLETSPILAYVWGRWKQNVYQAQVVQESFILTYSCKWLGEDEIIYGYLSPSEVKLENDFRIVHELRDIIDSADMVVAHNGIQFDFPIINTRCVYHRIAPPSNYRPIDTLRIARNKFRFSSNKLNDLCEYLGIGVKEDNGGFNTWVGYLNGEMESIQKMVTYNIKDVDLLEKLYLRLRPFDNSHPNVQIYQKDDVIIMSCPCCGSKDIQKTDKLFYTNLSAFDAYFCEDCGKRFRGRKNVIKNRENLIVGT